MNQLSDGQRLQLTTRLKEARRQSGYSQDHVARVLGEEPGTHEAMLRMSLAAGHLFLNPLGDGETLEKAREALAAYERKG